AGGYRPAPLAHARVALSLGSVMPVLEQQDSAAIESIELPLLLKAIYQRYGYDLRDYAPASLRRRVLRAMTLEKLATLSAFQERVLREPACMARFLDMLTVDV